MIITPVKTSRIEPGNAPDLPQLVISSIATLSDGSVIAVASKIVSICEGSIRPLDTITKDDLVAEQAQLFLPRESSAYRSMHTITKGSLMASAGIDESNSAGHYVSWPHDPLTTAKNIRQAAIKAFGVTNIGVIITDSTSKPMRLGTTGLCLASCGFDELNDYIGTPDLFDRDITLSRANIAEGMAAASVLVMGEGIEQTPIALISDTGSTVHFHADASATCYQAGPDAHLHDLYEPFFRAVDWQRGKDNV